MTTKHDWTSALCPQPPEWKLDWEGKFVPLSWVKPMIGCKQDPIHHAEGDVDTHVRMVCEKLIELEDWRGRDAEQRAAVLFGAALHDVAKPACTIIGEDGRITSPGHGQKGAQMTRQILWRGDGFAANPPPLAVREMVSALVRYSSLPLWLWDKEDPTWSIIRASQSTRCDWLALLSEADARGRSCEDLEDLLARIRLFRDYASEHNCLTAPYAFPSDHSRFVFFHKQAEPGQQCYPEREVFDDTRFEVTLMSGLPGAGKDRWIAKNAGSLPVVSLDTIRARLGVRPQEDQTQVFIAAREEARQLMRDCKSFVWNGTNVTRFLRDPLVRIFRDYGARIRIVYVEPPTFKELLDRNAERDNPVPEKVIAKLADKLEVPDLTEAHEVVKVTE